MKNSNLVIVELIGGLGNQMFQYAAGLSLARIKKADLKIDSSAFASYKLHGFDLKKWNVAIPEATAEEVVELTKRKFLVLPGKKYKEKKLTFNEGFFSLAPPVYLSGYWQSEKYFKNVRADLLESLTPKNILSDYSQGVFNQMKAASTSVSLHVRRGDYLLAKNQGLHGTCSLEYYQKSIKFFEEKYSNVTFFVFSDDIEWARQNLKFNSSSAFVDGNGAERNHEDLFLMSQCHHNVIANSSFSWWGAWLNNNPSKDVIAPAMWFTTAKRDASDIYCDGWLKF